MASYGRYSQNRARLYMRDPTSCIQFSSVFSKEGIEHIVQNWVWPNASGLEASCFLAECNRPTSSFPLLESVRFFHWHPGPYCAKKAQIRFSSGRLWLCQVLAKQIRSRSKPVCKDHPARFWPTLQSRSRSDANRIRHVYWVCWLHAVYSNTSC